ncbi:unnamed protein product [Meloidogyne enterolobii]|uniref:Uncharacterized protein n=1 Tax=Meloidogyne enterolobii TaxID=390850 RepID=A0ACB0YQF8_MELEN
MFPSYPSLSFVPLSQSSNYPNPPVTSCPSLEISQSSSDPILQVIPVSEFS